MALVQVSDENFQQEVVDNPGVMLLDFGAAWCGPCKKLDPIVEQLANEYQGRARIAKIDIGVNRQVAAHFGIMNVPTLLFLKDGKVVSSFSSVIPKTKIAQTLDGLL